MGVIWLALLFCIVALAYASVGFGGGSTYNALLAVLGMEYQSIPVIALICNVIVVTGGVFRFWRAKLYDATKIWPLLVAAAPAAFLGGLIPISEGRFYLLLGCGLIFSACALLLPVKPTKPREIPQYAILSLSTVVGFLAGLSGIGGGIFLAPLLHLTRWASAKAIAAFASLYILINSLSGLAGQAIKQSSLAAINLASDYWPLMVAVLIGGQVGGYIGLKLFSEKRIRQATAILVAYVGIRLLYDSFIAL